MNKKYMNERLSICLSHFLRMLVPKRYFLIIKGTHLFKKTMLNEIIMLKKNHYSDLYLPIS